MSDRRNTEQIPAIEAYWSRPVAADGRSLSGRETTGLHDFTVWLPMLPGIWLTRRELR